jgi:hypothetical protein
LGFRQYALCRPHAAATGGHERQATGFSRW